jgi:hypothetical protein
MVSITFGGVEVDNPVEWEEMTVSVEYDAVNQMTTIVYDQILTFYGSGYDYLYSKRNDNCELIPVVITSICGNEYLTLKGNVFITDCVFDELECSVQVTVQDDGYSSRIQNNKSIVVSLASKTTKNGEAITPVPETLVTFFTPSTGSYSNSIRGYRVYDVFRFIVDWMSDNKVTFESDYFNVGGDGYDDWICSGVDIRVSTVPPANKSNPPSVSFEKMFEVMRKIKNLAIGFQRDSSNNPVLRIEPLSYFRNSSTGIQISNVNKTELSYVKELLYAKVKIGSNIILPTQCDNGDNTCTAANNISYYGFQDEEYYITGECNENIELDLTITNDFVVDTNTIEDVLIYGNDTFDRDVFLIRIFENTPSAYRAVSTDVFGIGAYWYNEAYTNKAILERYIDYLTGTLTLFGLYNDFNLFLYEGNTPSSSLSPSATPTFQTYPSTVGNGIPLNNLVYDPENSIDTGTERFYPLYDGIYQFCVGLSIDEFGSPPPAISVRLYLQIEQYDSTNTLLFTYKSDIRSYITGAAPNFEEWVSPYIAMDAGDYVIFNASYAQIGDPAIVGQSTIFLGGTTPQEQYFKCCSSFVSIPNIQTNTGQSRRIAKTSMQYPLSLAQFKSFFEDTTKLIGVQNGRINRVGWNNSFKYRLNDGMSEISILSNDV